MSAEDATEATEHGAIELTALEMERFDWFEGLGFGTYEALELAIARDHAGHLVTVHDVRKALERGCDHATAFAIFS